MMVTSVGNRRRLAMLGFIILSTLITVSEMTSNATTTDDTTSTTATTNDTASSTAVTTNDTASSTIATTNDTASSTAATTNDTASSTAATTNVTASSNDTELTTTITDNTTSSGSSEIITSSTEVMTTTVPKASDVTTRRPNTGQAHFKLSFSIKFDVDFTNDLSNPGSSLFLNYSRTLQLELTKVYQSTPGFKYLYVTGFREGSIIGAYNVLTQLRMGQGNRDDVINYINNTVTKALTSIKLNESQADTTYLNEEMAKDLIKASKTLSDVCKAENLCTINEQCRSRDNAVWCEPKCKKDRCDNGDCYVIANGSTSCRCKTSDKYVYSGDRCEIRGEKLLLTSEEIIAIAVGTGGGIILLLVIALICVYCRSRGKADDIFAKNKSEYFRPISYTSDKSSYQENDEGRPFSMAMSGYNDNSPVKGGTTFGGPVTNRGADSEWTSKDADTPRDTPRDVEHGTGKSETYDSLLLGNPAADKKSVYEIINTETTFTIKRPDVHN